MIRNEAEYQEALRRLRQDQQFAAGQRQALVDAGLSSEEVERAMQPLCSFHAQLEEEVDWYEDVRRGNLRPVQSLTQIGRLLIALRIFKGLTQKQLADLLG